MQELIIPFNDYKVEKIFKITCKVNGGNIILLTNKDSKLSEIKFNKDAKPEDIINLATKCLGKNVVFYEKQGFLKIKID